MHQLTNTAGKWGIGIRIRTLLAIYFIFLIFDFTSSDELFPHFVYVIMQFYADFWTHAVAWTGQHILHLSYPITIKPNGSGDTTYNYILQLLWIVFTVIITIIWVLADRKRYSYNQFRYWSRIVVRYFLAYILFVYGFVKVIKLQFPFPDLIRLTEPYGESSPMGLAWAFIGYSKGYNIFIGSAEILAGSLLFFKRTTLIGSILTITIMINVAAMNFAYDIPVKIFSLNLVSMAIWIAWDDKKRLIDFFFSNKAILEKPDVQIFKTKKKKIIQMSLKTLTILFALYATFWSDLKSAKIYGESAPKPPLYGIYDIETFIRKDKVLPPLTSDDTRWKRIIINYPEVVRITNMTDSSTWMKLKIDTIKKTATFTSFNDTAALFIMNYREAVSSNHLIMEGTIDSNKVRINMKKFDVKKFPLVNRGFHWINEYPYNR